MSGISKSFYFYWVLILMGSGISVPSSQRRHLTTRAARVQKEALTHYSYPAVLTGR